MSEEKQEEHPNSKEIFDTSRKKNLLNIVRSLQPLIIALNIFGIYVFHADNNDMKSRNWKMKIFGTLVIISFVVVFFYTLNFPAAITGTAAIVDTIDEVPGMVILIQYVTSAVTASFLVSKVYIDIVHRFAELDTTLRVETSKDFYKTAQVQGMKFLILLTFTHLLNGIADFATAEVYSMSSLVAFSLYYYQKLQVLFFCIMIEMIRSRLKLINNYLNVFIQDQEKKSVTIFIIRDTKAVTEDKFNFIGLASDSNVKIRDLATMYDLIGKICLLMNRVCNFQMFMTLVSTFIYIVITIWTSLYYYRTPGSHSGRIINIVAWCFSGIYTVACMSLICERLLIVRNDTKILVNKIIMNYDLPKIMRVQAKAFMELIEAWPLRFYVYDMFSVDITLMLKFISVATTYLIVIIQISHFV